MLCIVSTRTDLTTGKYMTIKDEPGLGTIMHELCLWIQRKFISIMWGTEGLKEWKQRQSDDKPQEIDFKPAEPEKPIDNSNELISRIKEFASCEFVSVDLIPAILDCNREIIEPRIYRKTYYGDYINHLRCDVDSN